MSPVTLRLWPLSIWLSQLAVPLLPLVYAFFRWYHQMPFRAWLPPVVAVCGTWTVAVVFPIATRRGRAWLRARSRQMLAALAASIVTVVLCDIALTVTGIVPTPATLRSKSLLYRPSVSTRHRLVPSRTVPGRGEADVVINQRGLRAAAAPLSNLANGKSVLILGGSHVFDFDGANWPAIVAQRLSSAQRPIDVINGGVPGHCTVDSLGKLLTDLWLLEPDVIVLCQAYNDIKYFSEITPHYPYRDYMPVYSGDPRTCPSGVEGWLSASALYRLGRGSFWATIYGAEGLRREPNRKINAWGVRQYRLNVQTICDVGQNLGACVVLCKQARLATPDSPESDRRRMGAYELTGLAHEELIRAFGECDRVIEEVAAAKGCHVIDMHQSLTGRSECFRDHIHFTPQGSRAAARIVASALEPVLEAM